MYVFDAMSPRDSGSSTFLLFIITSTVSHGTFLYRIIVLLITDKSTTVNGIHFFCFPVIT